MAFLAGQVHNQEYPKDMTYVQEIFLTGLIKIIPASFILLSSISQKQSFLPARQEKFDLHSVVSLKMFESILYLHVINSSPQRHFLNLADE